MRFVDRPEKTMQSAQDELDRTTIYNCSEVKKYLSDTYRGICAYCECEVEVSNFLEVEHFYPKCQYTGFETDIHNLHLACKRCNNPKGSKTEIILSPNFYLENPSDDISKWVVTDEKKLSEKIRYCGHLLYSPLDEEITKNTISILRLNNDKKTDNREFLIESRLQLYNQAYSFFIIAIDNIASLAKKYKKTITFCLGNSGVETYFIVESYNDSYHDAVDRTLKDCSTSLLKMMKHGHPYSQMIIDNFAEPLKQLLSIAKRLEWMACVDEHFLEELETIIVSLNKIKTEIKEP